MNDANYRKNNDRTQNSSTYHKKDGTPIRSRLKREADEIVSETIEEQKARKIAKWIKGDFSP